MWISASRYQLPFPNQILTSRVSLKSREGWWLWLHDSSGLAIGIGEVAPWVGFGTGPQQVDDELATWARAESFTREVRVLELPTLAELWNDQHWRTQLIASDTLTKRLALLDQIGTHLLGLIQTPEVYYGVELAVLDALARSLSLPLAQLLEPRSPLSTPTHLQVRNLEEAITASRMGYQAIKLKVGVSKIWTDELQVLSKIRQALPKMQIRLDANQAWNSFQAQGVLLTASTYKVEWLEEPYQTKEDYAQLPANASPIGLDESLSLLGENLSLSSLIEQTKANVVTLKPMVLGGLLRTAKLALQADQLGVGVCVTHTLGSSVERSASTHLSAALRPNIPLKISGLGGALEGDIASALPVYGGELRLATEAGLAISLCRPPSYASAPISIVSLISSWNHNQTTHSLESSPSRSPSRSLSHSPSRSLSHSPSHPPLSYQSDDHTMWQDWISRAQRIPHPLEMARRARPHHQAILVENNQLSYTELYQAVCQLVAELTPHFATVHSTLNTTHLNRAVALCGISEMNWVIVFYALTGLGARVASLNPRLTQSELERALDLTDAELIAQIEEHELKLSMVSLKGQDGGLGTRGSRYLIEIKPLVTIDLSGLLNRAYNHDIDRGSILSPWSWESPLVTICTSGSTGAPQAISITTRQLCLSAFGSMIRLGHQHDDVWLSCLPPHHIGGLSILIRGVLNQITVRLCPSKTKLITQQLLSGHISITSLTPTLLSEVTQELHQLMENGISYQGLKRIRAILIGGGPTSQRVWEQAQALGLPTKLTWGMSETASQLCTQLESHPPSEPIPPLPFAQICVDDQERLWVSGPLTARGVLATGDIGQIHTHGVTIKGRYDDAIISGGVNLSPQEIEEVLSLHPQIEKVAVVGGRHPKYGARPVAFLVEASQPTTSQCIRPSDQELSKWCRERLSNYKTPDAFVWIDELPLTSIGKVKRAALRLAADQTINHLQQVNQVEREDL